MDPHNCKYDGRRLRCHDGPQRRVPTRLARPLSRGNPPRRVPGSPHRGMGSPGPAPHPGRAITMAPGLDAYRELWAVDFEYQAPPGGRPDPVCLVAREFRSGRTLRLWQDDLRARREPPYPTGPDVLFVAYLASAEMGCHLALGWPLPCRILDLYVEFRNRANGLSPPHGFGLLGALAWHGLDFMDASEKKAMQELALRGGPYTAEERGALLNYCESDVSAL